MNYYHQSPRGKAHTGDLAEHTFPSGHNYEGYWRVQKSQMGELRLMDTTIGGKGRIKYADGTEYEGEWRNNEKHGRGYMKWAGGKKTYSGDWYCDVAKGHGQFTWTEGEKTIVYTGEVDNNGPHGLGTFKYQKNGKILKVCALFSRNRVHKTLYAGCTSPARRFVHGNSRRPY